MSIHRIFIDIRLLGIDMTHWKPDQPYNDLPLLPPKQELESKIVLNPVIQTNKALAELSK